MLRRIALALSLALLFCLSSLPASAAGCTGTGNCYFFGGSDNWSNTAKWCTTDTNPCLGTTGGLPSSTDNCNFTALSNTTAYTVTADVTGTCLDITTALPSVSGAPTIATSSFPINVSGSMNYVAGTLATGGSGYGFNATTTGKTITTNGVSFAGSFLFNGVGGGWTLNDALTTGATRTLNVTNGTLNTNAQTVTAGFFVSTSGTRTLTFTNSTFNITGTSGTPWNVSATGSLTATMTGSTINFTGGAAGVALTITPSITSTIIYDTINITGAGNWNVNNTPFGVKNFSYTSTTNKTDSFSTSGGLTIQASGSLTIAGNSTVNRAFVFGGTLGTATSWSVPSTATVTLTNTDFRDITAAGTFGTWTGTSLGDCLGNSGITFDGSTTQTLTTNGTINWSTAANWTSRVPLPQDDVTLPNPGATTTLTADMPRMGRNIDMTNFNRTLSFTGTPTSIFGNLTLGSGMTVTGTQSTSLYGRGSQTITNAGKTLTQALNVFAFGGTYTQQDAFLSNAAFTVTNGTWVDQGFGMSSLTSVWTGSNARTVNVSGPWVISGGNGTLWSWATTTNLTVTSMPSLISFTGLSTTTATFSGGSLAYKNFHWANTATTATLSIIGYHSFRDFKIDNSTSRTVSIPLGLINGQTVNTFTQSNVTPGAVLTLNSSTPGSQARFISMGRQQSLNNLSITDIAAVGGAGWFAGNRSTNGGNNYGWQFRPPADLINIMKQRRSDNDNFKPSVMAA
jgi:hypothetical protein